MRHKDCQVIRLLPNVCLLVSYSSLALSVNTRFLTIKQKNAKLHRGVHRPLQIALQGDEALWEVFPQNS